MNRNILNFLRVNTKKPNIIGTTLNSPCHGKKKKLIQYMIEDTQKNY